MIGLGLSMVMLACPFLTTTWADPVLDKADGLLKMGRSDSASAVYREYLKQHPKDITAQLALAEIAIRQFDYAKARSILESTLSKHPESSRVAAALGHLLQVWTETPGQTVNYTARAQEHFTQALSLGGSKDPLVLTYLAQWQLSQDNLVAAEQNLQKAIQLNPTFVPAYQSYIRFYLKAKDLTRGKDMALHAIELEPANAETYFLTARLLALAGRPTEAVQYAQKSEQLDYGRMPERDYFLASQYEKLGQLDKATQYYENLSVYTPKEAQVWSKLGDLYQATNQIDKAKEAFESASGLDPSLLENLKSKARDSLRHEKALQGLSEWRRLLDFTQQDADLFAEGMEALGSLHYHHYLQSPESPDAGLNADLQRLTNQPSLTARLKLAQLKMRIARDKAITPSTKQVLAQICEIKEPDVAAGEACFILEDYKKAQARLDSVDGLSAEEYTRLADRLMGDQELVFSKVFYQRAFELNHDPSLQAGIKRLEAKQKQAEQAITEGNQLYNQKNYQAAVVKYQEASRMFRQGDQAYLRLGDTYERLKQWQSAKTAYDMAIAFNPSLMDSQGFAKNYKKLQRKATPKK